MISDAGECFIYMISFPGFLLKNQVLCSIDDSPARVSQEESLPKPAALYFYIIYDIRIKKTTKHFRHSQLR